MPKPRKQPPHPILAPLGNRLRSLRTEQGLSQERLALDAGLDRTFYWAIEGGERAPSLPTLYKLAQTLGVSLSLLLTGIEDEVE